MNWAFERASGKRRRHGRTARAPIRAYGHIYDFFAIDYEYPNGVHVLSMCRQISNCANEVAEHLVGTKGTCQVNAYTINGKRVTASGGRHESLRAGAHRPDREHPRRQAAQRAEEAWPRAR